MNFQPFKWAARYVLLPALLAGLLGIPAVPQAAERPTPKRWTPPPAYHQAIRFQEIPPTDGLYPEWQQIVRSLGLER
jgi:hypothetical protein